MTYTRNMRSERSGRPIANQFVIVDDNENVTFQSYDSVICTFKADTGILELKGGMWDYSNTTRKYFYQFVTSGEYIPAKFSHLSRNDWLDASKGLIIDVEVA